MISKTLCGKYVLGKYGCNLEVGSRILQEAISLIQIPLGSTKTTQSIKFDSIIGYSIVVPTIENDQVFYAKRWGCNFLSRFTYNKPLPTKLVTVELKQLERVESEWLLISSYLGAERQPEIEPNLNSKPTENQLRFWNSRAYCWGYTAAVPGTMTKFCPW